MSQNVSIVFPSSPCKESILQKNVKALESSGFHVHYKFPKSESFLFSASIEDRVSELSEALLHPSSNPVLCARGGYGASDLLPYLPWSKLKSVPKKWLVGFSDISALHCALYSILGWPSIHGPMPGTEFWGRDGDKDLESLYAILNSTQSIHGSIRAKTFENNINTPIDGILFGACMSVLCNLIGTPYFPKSLEGTILFLEDTGENPGSLLRMFNQLLYSKILSGVKAIILGNFEGLSDKEFFYEEIAKRTDIPIFLSDDFGHLSPNMPLVIGSNATLSKQRLDWSYKI